MKKASRNIQLRAKNRAAHTAAKVRRWAAVAIKKARVSGLFLGLKR
jgi:hypothetical protein